MNDDILEKIRKIEALINGATTEGEKEAAQAAKERVMHHYSHLDPHRHPVEFSLKTSGKWHRQLLLALCNKHGLKPYRYHRQKYTTVMVRVNAEYMDKVLWMEYLKFSNMLSDLFDGIADNLINQIHGDQSETEISGSLE